MGHNFGACSYNSNHNEHSELSVECEEAHPHRQWPGVRWRLWNTWREILVNTKNYLLDIWPPKISPTHYHPKHVYQQLSPKISKTITRWCKKPQRWPPKSGKGGSNGDSTWDYCSPDFHTRWTLRHFWVFLPFSNQIVITHKQNIALQIFTQGELWGTFEYFSHLSIK